MVKLIKRIALRNVDVCSPWHFFKPKKPDIFKINNIE